MTTDAHNTSAHTQRGTRETASGRAPARLHGVANEPEPITVFEIVKRSIEICDPTDSDERLDRLLLQFEDADEPVTAVERLDERLAVATEAVDVELADPTVAMAVATILYLAHRRDELGDEPHKILRLAARAEWKGDPPEAVRDWLAGRGVEV